MDNRVLQPVDDTTVRHRIAQQLTKHIVAGNFQPGQRLTEQELASSLQVSRGPLREAIRELAETGLLVSVPYKGLYVRSVTRRDLEELYSLRTTLERFAFERCWQKRSTDSLADLSHRNADLVRVIDAGNDGLQAIALELQLHAWCYELSDHRLLQRSWESMLPNLNLYFSLHQRAHGRSGPLRESHDRYVELAHGDSLDDMLEHLTEHMRQGLATTLTTLGSNLAS